MSCYNHLNMQALANLLINSPLYSARFLH